MSFGFSVGDIILVSQLAYGLYASISSGRKAASRDLKELGDVLLSLNCALDHLREVSGEVLAQPGFQDGGSKFKEKLDAMISSCAATLQELETMTEKYRSVESQTVGQTEVSNGKKRRTLDDMKKNFQVSWHRVRWDYEKQSLQQYREKLKSHTDAITLILTSVIWANSAVADEKNRKGHEKTHSLLEEVLRRPHADDSLQTVLQEIRSNVPPPSPDMKVASSNVPFRMKLSNTPFVAAYSLSRSSLLGQLDSAADGPGLVSTVGTSASLAAPLASYEEPAREINLTNSAVDKKLSELNARRRAFGAKEFEAFKKRHLPPKNISKPSFLKVAAPNINELHECIPYIFKSQPEGKLQLEELKREIQQWTQGFCRLVNNKMLGANSDAGFLAILRTLNENVETPNQRVRQLFYEVSDSVGLPAALDQVLMITKSVRVMKEIDDFQDTKEEWQDHTTGN